MKIVFLYTEIADYFLSACLELSKDAEVHIVKWEVAKEAPFKFDFPKELNIYERGDYNNASLMKLMNEINPDIVFCSGWIDKGYLSIIKNFKNKIPTVLTMDNIYVGNLRQRIAILFARISILKNFSQVWVPGELQRHFALKLGFDKNRIKSGFYTANTPIFEKKYLINRKDRMDNVPKRFLFVGRYVKEKGILELWDTYRLYKEGGGTWDLWCVGTGALWDERPNIEGLKHFGFVQPGGILEIIEKCGVYVLPSYFEPWGVSVHELAASGFPMLLSNKIGSANRFLQNGKNGYLFESGNKKELLEKMNKISNLTNSELFNMGEIGFAKSKVMSPEVWSQQAQSFLIEKVK